VTKKKSYSRGCGVSISPSVKSSLKVAQFACVSFFTRVSFICQVNAHFDSAPNADGASDDLVG